jgi:cytochrome b pre-mRNA-processing protein 3
MFLTAKRTKLDETIERLYGAIVAQARQRVFYSDLAVPDTVEGRFDLLVLHIHLLYRRLSAESVPMRDIGQGVFDRFVADMDATLRELGVGDLAVPKRMRAMGEAFYGRSAVYDAALADADESKLAGALLRNVYSSDSAREDSAELLSRYVRETAARLSESSADAIVTGAFDFPLPESVQS